MNPDSWLRDRINAVPVPPDLEGRIRASVSARRFRWTAGIAAAVLIGLTVLFLRPAPPPVPSGPSIAFSISLSEPSPEPLPLQEIQFTARVDAYEDLLVLTLIDAEGGPYD